MTKRRTTPLDPILESESVRERLRAGTSAVAARSKSKGGRGKKANLTKTQIQQALKEAGGVKTRAPVGLTAGQQEKSQGRRADRAMGQRESPLPSSASIFFSSGSSSPVAMQRPPESPNGAAS